MNIRFLPEAAGDVERLYAFLHEKNPLAAYKAMLAIDEGVAMLESMPRAGVKLAGREEYRDLFVPFGRDAYVLRYRLHDAENALIVVRVWHSRERR